MAPQLRAVQNAATGHMESSESESLASIEADAVAPRPLEAFESQQRLGFELISWLERRVYARFASFFPWFFHVFSPFLSGKGVSRRVVSAMTNFRAQLLQMHNEILRSLDQDVVPPFFYFLHTKSTIWHNHMHMHIYNDNNHVIISAEGCIVP